MADLLVSAFWLIMSDLDETEEVCYRCKKRPVEMVSPAYWCKPCWDEWWNAPEEDDKEWDEVIKRCKKERENAT